MLKNKKTCLHVGSFSSAIQNDHTNYPPTKILYTHVRQQALLNVCVYLTDLYNHLSYKVLTISVGPGTENGLNLLLIAIVYFHESKQQRHTSFPHSTGVYERKPVSWFRPSFQGFCYSHIT